MEQCQLFIECGAPLCPIDDDLNKRLWYADEEICRSRIFGRHRWIKKQRSIKRRQTKTWLDHPVTYQELYDSSRKRQLSDNQLKEMKARLEKINIGYAQNSMNKQKMSNIQVL